jgi:hypothetical protein
MGQPACSLFCQLCTMELSHDSFPLHLFRERQVQDSKVRVKLLHCARSDDRRGHAHVPENPQSGSVRTCRKDNTGRRGGSCPANCWLPPGASSTVRLFPSRTRKSVRNLYTVLMAGECVDKHSLLMCPNHCIFSTFHGPSLFLDVLSALLYKNSTHQIINPL